MKKQIAKTQYKKGYWLVWNTGWNSPESDIPHDIQVVLENDKGNRLADAVCHNFSYGSERGLWEIMAYSVLDDVKGFLNFSQVLTYFNKAISHEKQKN